MFSVLFSRAGQRLPAPQNWWPKGVAGVAEGRVIAFSSASAPDQAHAQRKAVDWKHSRGFFFT